MAGMRLAGLTGAILVCGMLGRAVALPGDLDPSFGTGGIVITPLGTGDDVAQALVAQADDRLVVVGSTHNGTDLDLFVARYDTTGMLDSTFGTGGIVRTSLGTSDDVAAAVALAPGGEIVVAGSATIAGVSDVLVARYLPNGTLDPSFGTGGVVRTPVAGGAEALAVVVEPNDRIAVAGRAAGGILLGHFTDDGDPDTDFGPDGIVVTPVGGVAAATSIVRTGADRFFVAGWVRVAADADLLMVRYRTNGRLDPSFGSGGIVVTPLGTGDDAAEAVVQTAGGFLAAGWTTGMSSQDIALVRYAADGTLDAGFGIGGIVVTSLGVDARANALAIEDDDRVLVAGRAAAGSGDVFALLRYETDGTPDASYGAGGVVLTPIGTDAVAEGLALLHNGRGVAAGHASAGADTEVALARYAGSARCGNDLVEPENGEVCDGGNRSHGDCCGPTCQYDTAGSGCLDDGDACTDDVCDGAGTCTHPAVASACDARLCYAARSSVSVPPVSLALANAYAAHDGELVAPGALCAPADVGGGGVSDATVFGESYRLRVPRQRYRQDVAVADRFGLQRLRVLRPDRALLPTSVALDVPAGGAPAPGAADGYECYRVRNTAGTPGFPAGVQVTIADAFGDRLYDVVRPHRLCLPTALEGGTVVSPLTHLVCYNIRLAHGESPVPSLVGRIHTANLLGTGRLDLRRHEELCVPALREPCGVLPPCMDVPGQSADCHYDPGVTDPRHAFCRGPRVVVDAGHENFHTIADAQGRAGRWWGFARLLLNDGYDVQQSSEPLPTMLHPSDLTVLVIANPTTLGGLDADALQGGDVRALVDWVERGGSLLLVIDHTPYEQVGRLLRAIGLVRLPAGESPGLTFTTADGTLNATAAVTAGPGPGTAVDEVTTFTGTAFTVSADPPPGASYEPVLIFPSGTLGFSNGVEVDMGGMLEAVAIQLGAGRIFVSGEAGGLTAQDSFGMQETPQNERYVRNVMWWLTQ